MSSCDRLFKDCTDQVHRPRKKRASKPSYVRISLAIYPPFCLSLFRLFFPCMHLPFSRLACLAWPALAAVALLAFPIFSIVSPPAFCRPPLHLPAMPDILHRQKSGSGEHS